MATKPIKNDLFRFITFRTPQLIREERKELGFLYHPDIESSFFYTNLDPNLTNEEKRTAVRSKASTFSNPLKSYLEVKKLSKKLYNFSTWLTANRETLTKSEVDERMNEVTSVSNAKRILIWDNLFYQIITKQSPYVRQACIQILMADNFITKANAPELTENAVQCVQAPCDPNPPSTEERINLYLQRLAKVKLVIEKDLFSNIEKTKIISKNYDSLNNSITKKALNHVLKQDLEIIELAKKELKSAEIAYNKAYIIAEKDAKKRYKDEIEPLIQNEKNELKRLQEAEYVKADEQGREPRIISSDLVLPEYNFEFESSLANTYLSTISSSTEEILNRINLKNYSSIGDVISLIEKEEKSKNEEIISNLEVSNNVVNINGSEVALERPTELDPLCFMISKIIKRGTIFNSQLRILFGLNTGNSDVYILEQSHNIIYNSTTENNSITDSIISNPPSQYQIIFNDLPITINDIELSFNGTIKLSNGLEYSYDVTIPPKGNYISSCLKLDVDPNNPTDIEPIENPNLYGVNKLGIADFRKVEQEVCCYVPGQVSHIENILAREYKERSTRNLLSVENISEETSETEVESLTDTTTSERNEMATEVSNVLNEDKSQAFGASAGVSGGNPNTVQFTANGYADFASSTSTSQSNSSAQNYAQEITERTLERIVQKTTKKRTSRILKEFEENNKHGFDNREGTDHVSGVYRWIDIIYKNQLINYGKRLMYEFVIPEPSRFFKEAIIKDSENNSDAMVIKKPIHPSELSIGLRLDSSRDLTRANYQKISSIYGAIINSYPEAELSVSKSFASNKNTLEDFTYSTNESIEIPDGYYSDRINLNVVGVGLYGLNSGYGYGITALKVGNLSSIASINNNFRDNIDESLPNITGFLSISYTTVAMHSSTGSVTLKCKLTQEREEQWKIETYNAILEAYNQQLDAYKLDSAGNETEVRFNPLFNRAIEKREIKRISIEMLTTPFSNPMGQNNYVPDAANTNIPVVNQNANFENHASHVKFFEQAFDWEIMAYLFYPYYWADKKNWVNLLQKTDAGDPIFQAFLQSGMSRAVVPVRPGFEDAVLYYMETGEIWNGGDLVLDHDDDLYISIAEEMQIIEGAVEKEWETRVPTALTMIQKDTVGLDETGLPCCDFVLENGDGENYTNPIVGKTTLLGVPNAEQEPQEDPNAPATS